MLNLLLKPRSNFGLLHQITPETANWKYVGFSLHKLKPGNRISYHTDSEEAIIVLVEGQASFLVNKTDYGILGERLNVFEKTPPVSVYISINSNVDVKAISECIIAVCTAPGRGNHNTQVLKRPELIERGQGANKRFIYNIAMEDYDVADSLLVTEVFTPNGNWSSYPPHRHDEDNFPEITYLEETYYHRINPEQGYGTQRVWTEDGNIDQTFTINNHDVVLVPGGHHPCGVAYGYEMYYLNVMAGPLRKWRYKNHPDHDWILKKNVLTC